MFVFSAYVTRFLFTLCLSDDYGHDDDDNHENYAVQPLERCHRDDCESCPCQLCSSVHEHSVDGNDDSQSSSNKFSVKHVYDDDGDLIVERKCHQKSEIIYIG